MVESKRRRSLAAYFQVLPTWMVLGCFFLLPLVIMLVISFAQRGTYGGLKPLEDFWAYVAGGEFLANYRRSIEPLYLSIYWRSLWMAVATTVLCLVVSYPLGIVNETWR